MVDKREEIRTIKLWRETLLLTVESKLRDDEAIQILVYGLVEFILSRWSLLLKEKRSDDWVEFYKEHHKEAIGAIIAIIELLEAIGEGKSMPDKYVQMLKEMSV